MTEIVDNMIKKRTRTLTPDRSVFVYSAHDVTLVNLMRALDIVEHTSGKSEYAATLVLEMHHSNVFDDDFEVKVRASYWVLYMIVFEYVFRLQVVYYFNSEDKFPKEIPIKGCNSPCSLSAFSKSIEKVTLRDYDEICRTF